MALYLPLRMDGSDDPAFEYTVPVNPHTDQLAAAGFYPQNAGTVDAAAGIERDVTSQLVLRDPIAGAVALIGVARELSSAEITANVTTSSTAWSDLLALSITTRPNHALLVLAQVTFSNSSTNTANYFRVVVDGVARRGSGARYVNAPSAHAGVMVPVPGIAPGAHAIKLQWRVDSGTCRIRPVAAPDSESCALLALGL